MKERGKFFWKERWFSFCSRHREYDESCDICKTGSWKNIWKYNISSLIYKKNPNLWIWWVNK
jgi:hypothetical protein